MAQVSILATLSDNDKVLVRGLQAGQEVEIRLDLEIRPTQRQFVNLTDDFKIALGTHNNIQLKFRTVEGAPGVGDFTICTFRLL
jgi:hypothetical protein